MQALKDYISESGETLNNCITYLEFNIVKDWLEEYGNNKTVVGKKLGLARTTLLMRCEKYGLKAINPTANYPKRKKNAKA